MVCRVSLVGEGVEGDFRGMRRKRGGLDGSRKEESSEVFVPLLCGPDCSRSVENGSRLPRGFYSMDTASMLDL